MRKMKNSILSLIYACVLGVALVMVMILWLGVSASHHTAQAAPLGNTWYVRIVGDDDNDCLSTGTACRTVGAAVNKAADDDTIMVGMGVFTETIFNSKDLTIIGTGAKITILDGNQMGRVIHNSGELTLENLMIRNGLTDDIYGGGIYNFTAMTLMNTLVVSNSSNLGGGINNRGVLHMQNSAVISNTSAGSAGGIYNYSSGLITVENSLIAGNSGNNGGGVYNHGGDLVVFDSTVQDNNSNLSGGGIIAIGGSVVLSGTTIHDNETSGGGGGIVNNIAVFTITNSTISDNAAYSYGGMQVIGIAQTTILNSTIAYNQKTSGSGTGGIGNSSDATMRIKNSIVAGNDGFQCLLSGTWISEGYNISSDSRCGFNQTGDMQNTDPLLGPLADYGGATLTRALMPGSPAIDAGDNVGCPAVDQRGVERPVDGDNDGTPVCDIGSYEARQQITISDAAVVEGDSGLVNAVITVTLTPTSPQSVSVDYATAGITAVSGDDFKADSGTLTFDPGQQTKFITIKINGDTEDEADETFSVDLSNAQDADLVDSQALVTIIDDDGLSALTISDQSVDEGNGGYVNAVFEVALSPASDDTVTVDYATTDGTAEAGVDYTAASGTLTFIPGETTKFITVTVSGDIIDEGDSESFTVDLSNESNANLADGQGLGLILDDDQSHIFINIGPQVIEGDVGTTTAVFTVNLSAPTAFAVTVDYASGDGYEGAVAGSDYEAISGTLTFLPGEVQQNINVTVYGDTECEGNETFRMDLSNPDPLIIHVTTSIATIIDDDFRIYLPMIIQ